MLIGLALVLAALAFVSIRLLGAIHSISPKSSLGDIVGLAGNQDDTPGTLAYKIKHGQRVNILLLGYGGAGHQGSYLTDSIMVISVQGADRVAMTSIPRDTFVKIMAFANGGEYDGKINAAYEIPLSNGAFGQVLPEYDQGFAGGGKLASKVVGDYIGQPIDYWLGVDFAAFQQAVDAVNGIDVVNPYVLDDSEYPLGETYGYTHIHFNAGPLHLTGTQALVYVRERHADNDFGRSRRQQQVLLAIKDKALSIGAMPHFFDLLSALQDHVKTDMTVTDLRTFSAIADKVRSTATHHVSIDNTALQYDTFDYGGQYILLPRDHTLGTLHHFVANELPPPNALAEKAQVRFASSVSEATQGESLGGVVGRLFAMIGFSTSPPATLQAAPATTVIHDYSGGRAAKTVAWLQQYFNASVVVETPVPSPLPSASPNPLAPDVLVELGKDFAGPFDAAATPTYVQPQRSIPSQYLPPPSPTPSRSASPTPSMEPTSTPTVKPTGCGLPICPSPPHPTPSATPSSQPSALPSP